MYYFDRISYIVCEWKVSAKFFVQIASLGHLELPLSFGQYEFLSNAGILNCERFYNFNSVLQVIPGKKTCKAIHHLNVVACLFKKLR